MLKNNMHKKVFVLFIFFLFLIIFSVLYFSKIFAYLAVFFIGIGDFLRIIFSNPAGITDIAIRIWSIFIYGLGIKKRHHPWGVVYDSETKQPIYGAHLSLLSVENKVVAKSITDQDGRYGFLVDPGFYHITAQKKGYIFPSSKLFGKGSDVVYNDLYFGNFLEIKKYGDVITNNIPMYRLNFDWREFAAESQHQFKFYHSGDKALGQIINVSFYVGFLISIMTLIGGNIKFYNLIILFIYIIMFFSNRTQFGRRVKGSVFFKDTGAPVAYGILRLKSSDGKEVLHKIIDHIGNYYCLVPDGLYNVIIEKKNQDGSYVKVYEELGVKTQKGYLNKAFKV